MNANIEAWSIIPSLRVLNTDLYSPRIHKMQRQSSPLLSRGRDSARSWDTNPDTCLDLSPPCYPRGESNLKIRALASTRAWSLNRAQGARREPKERAKKEPLLTWESCQVGWVGEDLSGHGIRHPWPGPGRGERRHGGPALRPDGGGQVGPRARGARRGGGHPR